MNTYDNDTEIAVLCAMLDDDSAIEIAKNLVTGFDFQEPRRGKLFCLIRNTYNEGVFDIVILRSKISIDKDKIVLEHALHEAIAYLGSSAANIEEYCRRLKSLSLKRSTKQKLKEISERIDSIHNEHEVTGLISKAASALEVSLEASIASVQGSIENLGEEINQALTGERTALAMPWPILNERTNALLPGTITVLCGSPGASKSLMLLQLLIHLFESKVKFASLSLEDGTTHQMRRAFAQFSGCSTVTNDKWCKENPDVAEALKEWNPILKEFGKSLFELHRDETPTIEKALDWVTTQARKGCRVIVLDPFTLLDFGPKPWVTEREFLMKAKRIMEQYKCSLILVTHPRKQNVMGQKGAPISMDDLAGSTAISRFTHTIIWLQTHEPKVEEIKSVFGVGGVIEELINRTVLVLKSRNAAGGGRIGFSFNVKTLKLEEKGLIS